MITNIYCAVHLDYNLPERDDTYLTDNSFWYYAAVKNRQQTLFSQLAHEPESALIYIPCNFNPDADLYDLFETPERNIYQRKLQQIVELHRNLGSRFILCNEYYLLDEDANAARRYINLKLKFAYDPRKTRLIGFGEYADQCVVERAKLISQYLYIPQNNLIIDESLSIRNRLLSDDEIAEDMFKRGFGHQQL